MLSLIAAKSRADGGLVERADRLLSIRAAVLAIQLFSERALPRKSWPVARAQTIRSKKSPDGSKSVLFRQQPRDQARSRPRSDGVTAPSRRSSAGRVSS